MTSEELAAKRAALQLGAEVEVRATDPNGKTWIGRLALVGEGRIRDVWVPEDMPAYTRRGLSMPLEAYRALAMDKRSRWWAEKVLELLPPDE